MAYHDKGALHAEGMKVKKKAVDVTAGKEYDLMKTMFRPDSRNPQQQDADELPTREEVRAQANKAYADIPDLFTWFATPDPAKSNKAINELWVVVRGLGGSTNTSKQNSKGGSTPDYPIHNDKWQPNVALGERSADISNALQKNWDGEAYRAFMYNFVHHIDTTISHQANLAHALAFSLDAHKAVREAFHTDIWKIGENTWKALDAVGDCTSDDVDTVLTVFTAIAGVALAVPTDGLSLVGLAGLTKEAVSSEQSIKGALKSKGNKKAQISGPTVDVIVRNMRSAVSTLQGGVAGQEYDLYNFVNSVSQNADGYWDKYVVPKPGKLTALDDAGLGTLNGDDQFYDR